MESTRVFKLQSIRCCSGNRSGSTWSSKSHQASNRYSPPVL
uniref:Uncharacterized protein n=1 Tax=Rhizophora mucronata TaxID=61149 RepID=A0A2P2IQ35_RHIMU